MTAVAEKNLTIREALFWAEAHLCGHGVPESKIGAEYLLAHVLGCKRVELHIDHNAGLDFYEMQTFQYLLDRRTKREPLQYIVGSQEFYGLDFKVTPDVLIPRPETELLVEETIKAVNRDRFPCSDLLRPRSRITSTAVLDLCTGSGCIAVCLAKEFPQSSLYALDDSKNALDIAQQNADRHGVSERITFVRGDLFEPLKKIDFDKRFEIIVSNPPYVSKKEMDELQPEVRDYEPARALCGGKDGLDFYRRIIQESPSWLNKGGHLLLEIGYGQSEKVRELFEGNGLFHDVEITKDLAGIERVVKARFE